jgi:hypothetical protein
MVPINFQIPQEVMRQIHWKNEFRGDYHFKSNIFFVSIKPLPISNLRKYIPAERLLASKLMLPTKYERIRQKFVNFLLTHIVRMSFIMKKYKSPDPVDIGFFSPRAIVPGANRRPNLVE